MARASSRSQFAYAIQIISALLGLLLSLFLYALHLRLIHGMQEGMSQCTLGTLFDCDRVNISSYSQIFGIPIAAIGSLYYFVLLLLAIGAPPLDERFPSFQRLGAWLGVFGLLTDVFLFGIQAVVLKNFCLFCLGTYLATFFYLFCVVRIAMRADSLNWKEALRDRLQGSIHLREGSSLVVLLGIAILSFGGALFLFPSFIRVHSQNYAMVDHAMEQFFQRWKTLPERLIPKRDFNGSMGNPSSRVQIVEFSDFECPHCRRAAFTLHTALHDLEKEVYFVFKNYPLDSACNPKLNFQLHREACRLARLAVCAQREGVFWKFHNTLFLKTPESVIRNGGAGLSSILDGLLPPEIQNRCLADESTLEAVRDDIQVGSEMGVQGTPAIFINGKMVSVAITIENLRRLVAIEMSEH